MEFETIKLDPDDARVIKGILQTAYRDMGTAARQIAGMGSMVHEAYRGSGTGQAVENYGDLGKSGDALKAILEQLETDFGIVITEAEETDLQSQGVVNGVNINAISPDAGVVAGI
ncbi:hypothetical protein ACL02R_02535 [Streptomyces sp. MS19]|uniref:hypothetical protein n=1 Tax=Streptomyces sp. MS19 TaxID=3385972 RepID=UPI0039A06141